MQSLGHLNGNGSNVFPLATGGYNTEMNPLIQPILAYEPTCIQPMLASEITCIQPILAIPIRQCTSCEVYVTPHWRYAADRTLLCNACGLRYMRNGGFRCPVCLYVPYKRDIGLGLQQLNGRCANCTGMLFSGPSVGNAGGFGGVEFQPNLPLLQSLCR